MTIQVAATRSDSSHDSSLQRTITISSSAARSQPSDFGLYGSLSHSSWEPPFPLVSFHRAHTTLASLHETLRIGETIFMLSECTDRALPLHFITSQLGKNPSTGQSWADLRTSNTSLPFFSSNASHGGQALPPTTIPCMSSIGPTRRLDPMREDHRVDDLATIHTAPPFERETARIVSKIHEAIWDHHSLTTLASHGSPPCSFGFIHT